MSDTYSKAEYEALASQIATLEAALDEALEQNAAFEEKASKLETVNKDLTGKVRGRAWKDAAEKIFDELKVKKEIRGDLYDLARIEADADEPDTKKLKQLLADHVEKRKGWAVEADETAEGSETKPDGTEAKAAAKRLDPDEEGGRGGRVRSAEGRLKIKKSDIRDPEWMRVNQNAYAQALAAGTLQYVD